MTAKRTPAEVEQANLERDIQIAGQKMLLKALKAGDPDSANTKSILQVWNERNAEKLAAALAENAALKAQVTDNSAMNPLTAQNAALTEELEKIKNGLAAVLAEEMKKIRQSVQNETGALIAREVTIKRREDVLESSTSAQLTLRAFDFLGALIKRMPSWEPKDFFDPAIPKSPWIWRIWFDEQKAKNWCAWEIEIAAKPREQQVGLIAHELHVRACIQHQYEKIDTSPERKEFLEARARHMGVEDQVYEIGRQMTSQCMLKPHPMPSHANLDEAYMDGQRKRILLGEVPTGNVGNILPHWL
jgi:hypothetical protein